MNHVVLYKQQGRYAGWPANYGIWSWGDEIVVGFAVGHHHSDGHFHARDTSRPFETMQARSMDGGVTWTVEPIPARIPGGVALSADEHVEPHLRLAAMLEGADGPTLAPGELPFTHPDFALMCARTGLSGGAKSLFYYSTDRCRSWQGPYRLPSFGLPGLAARTDYQVLGAEDAVLLLTAAKDNGEEGRVCCVRTTDGGETFGVVSWIGDDPGPGFHIMPASVRLPDGRLLAALRCREDLHAMEGGNWIDLYESTDDGATWRYVSRPVVDTGRGGNPPTLSLLPDGRLVICYGYRRPPYGIRAVISGDEGRTWGEERVLRDDAGSFDIGYPRTAVRADGSLVTVYYYTDEPGGACYIAATLWRT